MITSKYLAEYALAQVNRPYWIGGCGHRATKDLFYRLKNQYPKVLKDAKWEGDYQNDESEKVHDCCGLIKGASWCAGVNQYFTGGKEYQSNGCMDWSVSEMYKHCAETGSIDKLPEIPGLLLFNEKKSHVGIYIGQGIVVEARGHAYGVQKNKLKDRTSFKRWGKASWVNYEDKPAEKDHVKDFQVWLNTTYGERLLVDGIYGAYTKRAAARAIQREMNNAYGYHLDIDGYIGPLTMDAISHHMIVRGTKGNRAYIVQGCLYGKGYECNGFDGSVGAGCEAAIKLYQKNNNLEVDGKVGGFTFRSLVG